MESSFQASLRDASSLALFGLVQAQESGRTQGHVTFLALLVGGPLAHEVGSMIGLEGGGPELFAGLAAGAG